MIVTDYMTEAIPGDLTRPVRYTILGAGIPNLECLRNTDPIADRDVAERCCLPRSVPGFVAAPARAVVRE